jgi:hypothetical protein
MQIPTVVRLNLRSTEKVAIGRVESVQTPGTARISSEHLNLKLRNWLWLQLALDSVSIDRDFVMKPSLWIILFIVSFGFEGAGCSWMKKKPTGETLVYPRQTGSSIQRRVIVPTETQATAQASEKKNQKEKKKKSTKSKSASAKPTPTSERSRPKPKRVEEPEEEEEVPTAPDRLR